MTIHDQVSFRLSLSELSWSSEVSFEFQYLQNEISYFCCVVIKQRKWKGLLRNCKYYFFKDFPVTITENIWQAW